MKIHKKSSSGLGLLEVMVSLLVVSLGTLGVIRIQAAVLDAHCNAKSQSTATALAQMEFERVRAYTPATICSTTASPTPTDTNFSISGGIEDADCTAALTTNGGVFYKITVTSNSCKESGQEYVFRSFLRPFDASIFTASGGSNIAIPQPLVAKRLNDTVGKDSSAISASDKRPSGVAVNHDADGKYLLYVKGADGRYYARMESNVELVEVSGIVASRDDAISTISLNMQLLTTAVGYCKFPLKYTNADDSTTYTDEALPSGTQSAAYVCFVPTGWYGNIALDINAAKKYACPDEPSNTGLVGGSRSIKAVFSNVIPPTLDSHILGQSGVLKSHETSGKTRNLHYVVYGATSAQACNTVILNYDAKKQANQYIKAISHGASPTTYTISSQGYGGFKQYQTPSPAVAGLKGSACGTDASCLKPRDYWLEVNGALTISGTLSTSDTTIDMNDVELNAATPNPFVGVAMSACAVTPGVTTTFSCTVAPNQKAVLSVGAPTGVTISNDTAATVDVGAVNISGIDLTLGK